MSKNKQDDYFYGGILYAINAVQDLSSAQPKSEERMAESAQNVPNDELISKKAAMEAHCELCEDKGLCGDICPDVEVFRLIPSAQPEIIRCKDCRFFEYDHPYIVQGVPVLGHLVCTKWGDGCRTAEDGFCFMAERRTDEGET